MRTDVFFRILGPLQVTIADRVVQLAKNRQLTVLALLLTEANKVVSVGRIIDAVWGDAPPVTADKQIQTCVWRLRSAFEKAGGTGLIETARGGYLLRLPEGCLDAQVFEKAMLRGRERAEDGDLGGAVDEYRAALALFQGRPLAELESPAIEAVAAYWAERRLSVLEECLDIELAMGRHRELISELRLLVDEHPLREQLRGRLMTALYLSDRRADALAVYRAGRATLVSNLGLDPCARLQDLHRRIIAGHPITSPQPQRARYATKVPAQLPADVGDFTGRTEHLEWIDHELRRERPPVVALIGRGGVGKSALAVHAAHRARERFTDGQLHADLRGSTTPLEPQEVLSSFLYALGTPERSIPTDLANQATLFRSITAGKRLLIVLDDAESGAQIEPLLPGGTDSAVLVTSQSSMVETPGVTSRRIDGLDMADAVQLLGRLIGNERIAREPESARSIVDLCGHLPLALRAAGARLHTRPTVRLDRFVDHIADETHRIAELAYGSLDTGTRLAAAANRLSPTERALWLKLSIPDLPHISGWVAATVAGVTEDKAQRLLDKLVDHQLLDVVTENQLGGTHYEFHSLTRIRARQLADAELDLEELATALDRLVDVFSWLEAHARRALEHPGQLVRPPDVVREIGEDLLRDVTQRAELWLAQERPNLPWLHKLTIARPHRTHLSAFATTLPVATPGHHVA
ncbi:SARP family transcriptional regulator [Lentzea tibetensis]|uniref:SARP family transcriptional regulator n=1 Tax=Lentzea tibetensis TaxID=2591470 RepID=A0A563ENP3_9PSEU|nr:AfsR/SARP family transcriptional regulator [Lentzea tibetensis]TWP48860.1 SARP family transcriptional regulator [Lentzea tibetensis]